MESEVGVIFLVRVNLFRICRSEWNHGGDKTGMGRKTPDVLELRVRAVKFGKKDGNVMFSKSSDRPFLINVFITCMLIILRLNITIRYAYSLNMLKGKQ